MDGLKEILAAFEARVKSKVMGSVILAFIATNWKAIFYVIFEKTNSVTKFQYFDANTTIWTLLFIPLGVGVFLAATLPWVNFLGMKLTSFPDRKQRELKNNSQHLDVIDKLEYETKLQEIKARKQRAIVESAKADEDAKAIVDPEVREQVRQEFEETDHSFSSVDREFKYSDISLVELKERIEILDGELSALENEEVLRADSLNSLIAHGQENELRYQNLLEKYKNSGEEIKIQNLKFDRAQELGEFKQNFSATEEILAMVRHEIGKIGVEKREMMSNLESKYGI